MNPIPLFLIIVTLPLFVGGCGENDVNDEVKPQSENFDKKEPDAVNNPDLEGVNNSEIVRISGIAYRIGSSTPYSGKSFQLDSNGNKRAKGNWKDGKYDGLVEVWYESGQKAVEGNWKDGKLNGLVVEWHENGQKLMEANYKDGEVTSGKYWNSEGEPVNSREESKQ